MKYNIEKLVAEKQENKFLFFWGHQPSPIGTITKTCFSQWWVAPFIEDGIEYKTAEHWMMAEKARLFGDAVIAEKILLSKTPAEAKNLGREIQHFDAATWNAKKFEIVLRGNFHKFSQHGDLKQFLINTGNKILVEASPVDAIWGIGMAAEDPNATNPSLWKGENLLGFALMEVRDGINEIQ
ncbi:MAG: NADAR family protein [Chitinophagaceae bacterium]